MKFIKNRFLARELTKITNNFGNKRLNLVLTSFTLFLLLSLGIITPVRAVGNTCTWTGLGGDNKYSTTANWSGCASGPTNGDSLIFNTSSLTIDDVDTPSSSAVTLTNDINNLSIATLTAEGTNSHGYYFVLNGNAITLTSGIIANTYRYNVAFQFPITLGANATISGDVAFGYGAKDINLNGHNLTVTTDTSISGVVSGIGNIHVENSELILFSLSPHTWNGSLNISQTAVADIRYSGSLGSATNTVDISNGGQLKFCNANGATFPQNITVGGTGPEMTDPTEPTGAIISTYCGGKGADTSDSLGNINFSGTFTLTADTGVGTNGVMTVHTPLIGDHTVSLLPNWNGSLVFTTSEPTPTSTPAPTLTPTPTPSNTPTPIPSSTVTPSPTATLTSSPSPTVRPFPGFNSHLVCTWKTHTITVLRRHFNIPFFSCALVGR